MIAYLFLPKETVPPYQTLVYFPVTNSQDIASIFEYSNTSQNLYYIIKNGRSIDYLETREDIDTACLGFLGDSWRGWLGAIIPAVEDRIKLTIVLRGGLPK